MKSIFIQFVRNIGSFLLLRSQLKQDEFDNNVDLSERGEPSRIEQLGEEGGASKFVPQDTHVESKSDNTTLVNEIEPSENEGEVENLEKQFDLKEGKKESRFVFETLSHLRKKRVVRHFKEGTEKQVF